METPKPITPSSEDYLKTIFLLQRETGDAHLNDIACRMAVTKPSASHAVAQLTEKSLVEHRKFGPVRLTAKGQAVALDLFNEHSQWIASLFAGFGQHEREALSGLLRQVWRNVEIPTKDSPAVAAGNPR